MVSLYSNPGSLKCACISIKPGVTMWPLASITFASLSDMLLPILAILPLFISTSSVSSILFAGSTTCPFLINNFIFFTSSQQVQHSHPYSNAVCNLLVYYGLLSVCHVRRYFKPPVHRPGVHDHAVRFCVF